MTAATVIEALALPASIRADQRVPKKLLLENGAPTAADKGHISEGIEELLWLAALKRTTIGVPAYHDEVRGYLEIAVLRLTLRAGAKATRLGNWCTGRYRIRCCCSPSKECIPAYPPRTSVDRRTVLEGEVIAANWHAARDNERWSAFYEALALDRQPRNDLLGLYQGWIDTLLALHAACVTGAFALPVNTEHATARREALRECARLNAEIARLRAAAAKEKQMVRQVELNLDLKRVQAAQAAVRAKV